VFYGDLGTNSASLVEYFETAPGVTPCGRQNPATWMLDLIGAGTSSASSSGGGDSSGPSVDFHQYYKSSSLCAVNTIKVQGLCSTSEGEDEGEGEDSPRDETEHTKEMTADSRASNMTQFKLLLKRFFTSYWRNPDYNFVRMVISIIIALLFSSAFANYQYSTDVDTISLAAVIFITSLFVG
jgi:hypothetical protein